MEIPKSLRVGKTRYEVQQPHNMKKAYQVGSVTYRTGTIMVALSEGGKKRAPKKRIKTFWHEVVHAALYDMGSPLEGDERFVEDLAKRITDVVLTAKF